MPSQKVNNYLTSFFPIFFLVLILLNSGCAKKPWLESVEELQQENLQNSLQQAVAEREACNIGFNAEAIISWSSTFEQKSFSGILQLLPPTHAKLVTLNPLGQTVLALATNGKHFQTVNTLKREYTKGNFKSFVLRHDLPKPLLTGNLVYWLTGYIPAPEDNLSPFLKDSQTRGFWLVNDIENNYLRTKEYLLIDPQSYFLITRIITDLEDNILTQIDYSGWLTHGRCVQPTKLLITKFSTGAEASVHLKDFIWETTYTEEDFNITPPPGYMQRRYP